MRTHAIGIDCRLSHSTGIGRYVREIVPQVADVFGADKILLSGGPTTPEWAAPLITRGAAFRPADARPFRPAEQRMFRELEASCDMLWCPHFSAPWSCKTGLVVTVHDLIPLHVVAGWRGWVRKLGARVYLNAVRRNAALVLTVSEQVKGELVRELGVASGRIRAIPNGVDEAWFETTRPASTRAPYVVYVGNISPHKNVEGLLAAFAEVAERVPHELLIVGEERGFTSRPVLRRWVAQLGGRLRIVSKLSDRELRELVAGAALLVQPSFEEGFGLPPLEAMAAGCPVLTSDCAALLETAAQGAHRFRLTERDDLARVLGALLSDERLCRSKVGEGRSWARRFTWKQTAERTAAALREVWSAGRESK
jgi:glycosyltransferase involved in cell wall biosynthesis